MMADDTAEALRREADTLRDMGRWLDAADVYAAFLLRQPSDAGITMQQAHCLKEAGQAEAALRLYRAAMALGPRDGELALQFAHAARQLGRVAEAEQGFARAVALSPGQEAPWRLWQSITTPPESLHGTLLDLSPWVAALLDEREADPDSAPASGEVERLIASGALLGDAPPSLCALVAEGSGWRWLPSGLFHRLDHLQRAHVGPADPDWLEALAMLREAMSGAPLPIAHGATLILADGAATVPEHAPALRRAREIAGLRAVALITDARPASAPEQLPPGLSLSRYRWLAALPWHADAVLAASEGVARGLSALSLPRIRVSSLTGAPRAAWHGPAPLLPRPVRHGKPYVLYVAPMDAGQDHRLVFGAWLEWLRQRPASAVPDLICAQAGSGGAESWGAEAAMAVLDNAPSLRGKVHWLPAASDALLAVLHEHCLFTLQAGDPARWSPAVATSLAHGKPVLLPGAEEAPMDGGLSRFQAGSEPSLLAALQTLTDSLADSLADSPEARVQAAASITPPESWPHTIARLLDDATGMLADAGPAPSLPLTPGRRAPLRALDRRHPPAAMAVAEVVRAGAQWHPLEAWGVWTRPGAARLLLPLDASLSGPLRLELDFVTPDQDQAIALQVRRKGSQDCQVIEALFRAGECRTSSLAVPAGDGAVEVVLDCGRAVPLADGRRVGIGLRAVCVARADSAEDRLAMLESRVFLQAGPAGR